MPTEPVLPDPSTPEHRTPGAAGGPRRLDSRDLLGEAGVALIAHEGEVYALRRTRLGKLILTK